jgi:hypothetical protein
VRKAAEDVQGDSRRAAPDQLVGEGHSLVEAGVDVGREEVDGRKLETIIDLVII